MKDRYWVITNYVLLLMAAIIGYVHLLKLDESRTSCLVKGVLVALSALIALLGSYFLYDFQKRLVEYRKRVKRAYDEQSRGVYWFLGCNQIRYSMETLD